MTKCLLTITISVLVLVVCSFSRATYEVAKPGCTDHCGDVKIPYPFGIGNSSCYFDVTSILIGYLPYRIICDHTTNQPKPFIVAPFNFSYEVLSINVEDHSLRLSFGVAFECYTFEGPVPSTTLNNSYNISSLWPFELSTTPNRLVVVGCDTNALFSGDSNTTIGCMARCMSFVDVKNGTCSNHGCCETSIYHSGMSKPSIHVASSTNHSDVAYFNPCSYAFVAKLNCSEARKRGNGSFTCGANAQCIDALQDNFDALFFPSFTCQCLKGYTGNPYLSNGCQDIDECLDEKLNQCQKPESCLSKKGGYDCQSRLAKVVLGLSIGIGSMIGFILLYGLYKLLKRRKNLKKREHNFKKNGGLILQQKVSTTKGAIDVTKIFTQSELEKVTNNFNQNRVLGHGGQGTVYKGMLVDGTIVAVKKSKKVNERQLSQFINEVAILSQINHRNVVKLFGCCLEMDVPLLVYEFVPNDTLCQHIQHPTEDFHMSWKVRFQIAVECAGAIAYLHSSCSSPIYHRDIKSSNIFLDEKYRAKVSDFGTSKTISIEKTHVTTCVQGTIGYLDSEFFRTRQFSEKSDVYSFGVVLLELLTSKKPIFTNTSGEPRGLTDEFLHIMESSTPNQLHGILDSQVFQSCLEDEIEELAKLVKQCLNMNRRQRPTMKEVAMTLELIKSKHDKEGNLANAQGIVGQEGHVLNVSMIITNEDPSIDFSISLPR